MEKPARLIHSKKLTPHFLEDSPQIRSNNNTLQTRSILKKAHSVDVTGMMGAKMKETHTKECSKDDIDINTFVQNPCCNNPKLVTFSEDCNNGESEIEKNEPSSDKLSLSSNCETPQVSIKEKRNYTNLGEKRIEGKPKLVLCFDVPYLCVNFMDDFKRRCVALEKCWVSDRTITGIVLVRNIEYHKTVFVRYTIDKWKTYSDYEAVYFPNPGGGDDENEDGGDEDDRFAFSLSLPRSSLELEFAVCYKLSQCEYWDNNEKRNYKIQDMRV